MRTVQLALISVLAILLMAGQAMSYWVFLHPEGLPSYYSKLDQPAIKWLCLFMLLAAVAVGFVNKPEDEVES